MTKPLDIFCEVPCLTEKSPMLGGLYLQKNGLNQLTRELLVNIFKSLLIIILPCLVF